MKLAPLQIRTLRRLLEEGDASIGQVAEKLGLSESVVHITLLQLYREGLVQLDGEKYFATQLAKEVQNSLPEDPSDEVEVSIL